MESISLPICNSWAPLSIISRPEMADLQFVVFRMRLHVCSLVHMVHIKFFITWPTLCCVDLEPFFKVVFGSDPRYGKVDSWLYQSYPYFSVPLLSSKKEKYSFSILVRNKEWLFPARIGICCPAAHPSWEGPNEARYDCPPAPGGFSLSLSMSGIVQSLWAPLLPMTDGRFVGEPVPHAHAGLYATFASLRECFYNPVLYCSTSMVLF